MQKLSGTGYIQTIYDHALGRPTTDTELSAQSTRLESRAIDRNWFTIEIAQSDKAASQLIGSVMLRERSV